VSKPVQLLFYQRQKLVEGRLVAITPINK